MSDKNAKKSEKTPVFKKWWFWVIIVIVLIGVGGAAGGNKNEPTKVDSGTSTSEQKSEEKTDFAVGDIIAYDGKEITVVSVDRHFDTGNQFVKPESGKEFVRINVKIENKSEDKISYNTYDWELQDSDGDIQSVSGSHYIIDNGLGNGDLAAGGKKSGYLLFEVPKDDTGLVLHYKPSFWSDKTMNIKL